MFASGQVVKVVSENAFAIVIKDEGQTLLVRYEEDRTNSPHRVRKSDVSH